MSTVQRRRGKSLHLELPGGAPDERPPIVALFLIQFDVKAGYTIAWKQSVHDLELAESVEFKSLPSGLHNVKEDLVYFMHDNEHAGISAFVNRTTNKWERNALMLAVGALVPLDQGRLGRSWKHAENLKELAEELVQDPSKTKPLEDYWNNNHLVDDPTPSSSRPGSSQASTVDVGRGRRPKSMASALNPFGLSPYHPALALPTLVDSFGPLIFPLYKAALLRKKILLMHEAPVELACNFVYNISILSNIPSSVSDMIPLEPLPSRLHPLFSVGIHDIDDLLSRKHSQDSNPSPDYGWVACSTDDVMTVKTDIYDVLINIPPCYSKKAREKVWPRMKNSAGQELKASQRDLRRYRTLRQSMRRQFPSARSASPYSGRHRNSKDTMVDETTDDETITEQSALLGPLENTHETYDDASSTRDEQLIEPLSWSALAYNSFMWWASAGEKRAGLEEEVERDAAMFRDFNASYAEGGGGGGNTPVGRPRSGTLQQQQQQQRRPSGNVMTPGTANLSSSALLMTDGSPAAPEMAVIAYFHRLTALILGTLAQLVEHSDREEEEEEVEQRHEEQDGEAAGQAAAPDVAAAGATAADGAADTRPPEPRADEISPQRRPVYVGSEDMVRMGLDVWSDADRRFVEELLDLYWGRKADVQGGHIECCGVRIL